MDSDITQSEGFYKAWAWFEKNKQQVVMGVGAALVIGLIVYFVLYQKEQRQIKAGNAVSEVAVGQMFSGQAGKADNAAAYLKVADEYAGSMAGARALLMSASAFYVEGKYNDALTQFQRFSRDYRGNPLSGSAALGIASCYDVLGKTNEAVSAYKNLIDSHATDAAVPQAKFALARLYEAQGKPELAKNLFEDLNRNDRYSSIGSEAGIRLEELKATHPKLFQEPVPVVRPAANVPGALSLPATNAPKAGAK